MNNKTILLIGPMKNKKDIESSGGIIVLFEELIDYCKLNKLDYLLIDTNKKNYSNRAISYLVILYNIILKTPKVSFVSLHGTANDYLLIAPIALIIAKLFHKPFSIRKFAGNFIEVFERYSLIKQKIIVFVLGYATNVFFETKYLVNYFKHYNKNTFWFPNVRKKQRDFVDEKYRKRFIFLGQISKEKGVDILCESSTLLPREYQIDLYGELSDNYTKAYFNNYNVNYKGALNRTYLIETLKEYDVLVLPSFREGYPGVIVEAFSIGMPVIATNLNGIKEMVTNDSAVLIEKDSINQLSEAIQFFTEENYEDFRIAAIKQFNNFDTEIQTKKFFTQMGYYE